MGGRAPAGVGLCSSTARRSTGRWLAELGFALTRAHAGRAEQCARPSGFAWRLREEEGEGEGKGNKNDGTGKRKPRPG